MAKNTNKRKQKMIFIAVEIVVLIVLVIILFILLFSGEKKNDNVGNITPIKEMFLEQFSDINEHLSEKLEKVSQVKIVEGETDEICMGFDVSEYQGNIEWSEVASSGIDFVMVRVGYRSENGEIIEDACARYNLQEANAHGIYAGAYFFSRAITEDEALEEARWTSNLLSGYSITYPVAFNCEGFQSENSRQYRLTIEERTHLAEVFLDEIEGNGYTGMFYASKNELQNNSLWNTDELELKYRIWVAQYGAIVQYEEDGTIYPQIDKPTYWGKYAMWQYTNQGWLSGIDGLIDLNVSYFGFNESVPPRGGSHADHVDADPEVGVKFTEVNEQVTAKEATNLRSTMDQGGNDNIIVQLKNGEIAIRTGVGNNGWSRVEYNGQILYAVSSYLTTDLSYKPPTPEPGSEFKTKFTSVTENVTAKDVTNLRNRPSVEEPSEVIAQLHNGEVIVRTGVSNEGWSRVEYNGQTLYCISSYLQVVE